MLSKVIDLENFGTKFGQLVREKRGIEGLTQPELASLAGLTAPQISNIENGNIQNPQVKTVDALCVALNISRDERTNCHPSSHKRLPSKLLETVAEQFGIENPDVSEETLETFLRSKAIEFREMQDRLSTLKKVDSRISNLLAAAQDALEFGQFDYADDRLADAEEIQQDEHTLAQVQKQANLRTERAKAALLLGDVEKAFKHFIVSAGYFSPFDSFKHAKHLYDAGLALREYGMRHPGRSIHLAVEAYESALKIWDRDKNPREWADTMNGLGICFRRLGSRIAGNSGRVFLYRAIDTYKLALEVRSQEIYPGLWGNTQNNLAASLRYLGTLTDGEERKSFFRQSIDAHRHALEVRTLRNRPQGWGVSQNNLAVSLRFLAIETGGAEGVRLLAEAADACRAALSVRTRENFPVAWAMTQNNLARALIHRGELVQADEGNMLFRNALDACNFALEVRKREENPIDWAESKETLALACFRLAEGGEDDAKQFLSLALDAIGDASIVIDQEHMPSMYDRLLQLRKKMEAQKAIV